MAHRITVFAARRIVTMNPRQPSATHVAICEGRIVGVGDLQSLSAYGRYEIDESLADKVLMPGLVEGHCHLKEGSMWDMPAPSTWLPTTLRDMAELG